MNVLMLVSSYHFDQISGIADEGTDNEADNDDNEGEMNIEIETLSPSVPCRGEGVSTRMINETKSIFFPKKITKNVTFWMLQSFWFYLKSYESMMVDNK